MQKLFIIGTLLISLIVINCGKKQEYVGDESMSFSLSSRQLHVLSDRPNEIQLRRDDSDYGPEFFIETKGVENIATADKKLNCPGVMNISGKTEMAPDVRLFSFKISEQEFHGLQKLPLRTHCELTVSLTNNIGSQLTRSLPVILLYDHQPSVKIVRSVIKTGAQVLQGNSEFEIENYSIENTFSYPLGFTYHLRRSGQLRAIFSYRPFSQVAPALTAYSKKLFALKGTHLQLLSGISAKNEETSNDLHFLVQPGEKAQLNIYGSFSEAVAPTYADATATFLSFPQGYKRTLAGAYVWNLSDPKNDNGLSLWKQGAKISPEDETAPEMISPAAIGISTGVDDPTAATRLSPYDEN